MSIIDENYMVILLESFSILIISEITGFSLKTYFKGHFVLFGY